MGSTLLVTGAAGFIGSNLVEIALQQGRRVIAYDALTYAGHLENLESVASHPDFKFVHADIRDQKRFSEVLVGEGVDQIAHLAAESHVDRSITGPAEFIDTNVNGTFALLSAAKDYFESLDSARKARFRFLHVSTDEVFGSLGETGYFSESTPYAPNSPYSASKAASDHLARAWFHTYGLPVVITNCSNNYGPRQFPEKLIPLMIQNGLAGRKLPVYGKGENVRDWIHVRDHARGLLLALDQGRIGESYCFGGRSERRNVDVVHAIVSVLDRIRPLPGGQNRTNLIEFVTDRLGHDFRYAIDDAKAERELGFQREFSSFEAGLEDTLAWYLANSRWLAKVSDSIE